MASSAWAGVPNSDRQHGLRPLLGVRVLVTRAAHQADWAYNRLQELGAEVLAFPTIEIREHKNAEAWNRFEKIDTDKGWLLFTSANGVEFFFTQYSARGLDTGKLGRYKIAVIGTATKRAVERHGLRPDFIPSVFTATVFSEEFPKTDSFLSATVVRVRGNLSADDIDQAIATVGADVIPMTVYETTKLVWPAETKTKIAEFPPDVVMFTSGSTAEGLMQCLSQEQICEIITPATIVSIGPATSKVARALGFDISFESTKHSIPDLIEELAVLAKSHSPWRSK